MIKKKKKKMINSGYKLWNFSNKIIPGGNGLLSKRPDRYTSHLWPTYFTKANGINLEDLDGNKWKDFAQMGMGCAILGYNNKELNDYVCEYINKGINTTLNCPEETYLAKKLLKFNKFAKYVRFTRSGGEAMMMAIRIARAHTSSSKIAFSGYHGWHDWYLSTNIQNKKNLNSHLIKGLSTNGVPKELINTAHPFQFNSVLDLKNVLRKNKSIKIIVIEGARKTIINKEMVTYLNHLKKNKKKVIILDEITSGLRTSVSGVYSKISLNPSIVVYGKALGNGFAINAIVGDEVMSSCSESFISSSFHTERVGFVAAIKTLEIIKREKLWNRLDKIGRKVIIGYKYISINTKVNITTNDFNPLPSFEFNYKDKDFYSTYVIQELLKYGILGANSIYLSLMHTDKEINYYLKVLEKIFIKLSKIINLKLQPKEYLEIPVINKGFGRLT